MRSTTRKAIIISIAAALIAVAGIIVGLGKDQEIPYMLVIGAISTCLVPLILPTRRCCDRSADE